MPWWLPNTKIADKYVKEARVLVETQARGNVNSALRLLEAAITLCPRLEPALELKVRALLLLRRYSDVADMLKDYIPSLVKIADSRNSAWSSSDLKLRPSRDRKSYFKRFSDLRRKFVARLGKNCGSEGHWRYSVLGQACLHLGLMEDAILLLQTGKRLAVASHRRSSTSWSDDMILSDNAPSFPLVSEIETISPLITKIKQLLHRKTAAFAAYDAGLYPESIRHFSKILESQRGVPQAFLAECYMYRAAAYKSSSRIADSIADCNKVLSLDPSSIEARTTRAALFESIHCFPDSLHDLEHLKLIYNSVLQDKKPPALAWKRLNINYREIPGKLYALSVKIQDLKRMVLNGETTNVDYYAFMGLSRGCLRSELIKAYLLLALRHKPERSNSFLDRCEFADERDVSSVRERAKMSALMLYRLVQKGYTSLMAMVLEKETMENQRISAEAALQSAMETAQQIRQEKQNKPEAKVIESKLSGAKPADLVVYQGVYCRDIAGVGDLLSQAGFNHPIPIAYEALSC